MLAEFEKRTGAKVTFVPAQDPIINFLGSKIAGGAPPDVALLPQVGAVKQAVDKGWAKPVGPDAQAQLTKNYAQGWQDLGKVGGKQYAVYYKAANKSLIWYNAKVFENAGAKEPRHWKEFFATVHKIYDSGVTPSRSPVPTAGRSPTGSRTSTSPRRDPRSTTSSPSTRSSGRIRP